MSSIMEELYFGNIDPSSGRYPPDSPFVQASRRKLQSMERLAADLDESEREWFEKYCDAQGEMEEILRYDTFSYAL